MQLKRIQILILFCLLINTSIYLDASAAMSNSKNSRLQLLLEKAKKRKARQNSWSEPQIKKEESGILPAESSRTKEVVYEETTKETIELNKSVPKPKEYGELVDDFNKMFKETKTNIEEHRESTPVVHQEPVAQQEYIKEKPRTITKTTARPPEAIKQETTQVKVETKNEASQGSTTETVTQSKLQVIEVEDHPEETELEEDEFHQDHHHGFEDEDEEEAELDEDEGLMDEEDEINNITETTVKDIKPSSPKDKSARQATYLDLVKKSLKSLEEDAWNEVKFNMGESLEYFKKQKNLYPASEVDKFHKITLAFYRFAEGGLELDQGDFADFEDAEAHYLDSQDILDAIELSLNSKDATDKELLLIIQTVKKYINEDIEYIEEMIDLS